MARRRMLVLACLVGGVGCDGAGEAQVPAESPAVAASAATAQAPVTCTLLSPAATLPEAVRETSGLAQSRRDPTLFWTHNDAGNGPELFAIDAEGRMVARVSVSGAKAADWEDIESGPCGSGDCLFVADIGDNDAERERITVYQVPEPAAGATRTEPAAVFHGRYPGGPRDAESLFRTASGDFYVVTKGRSGPIELYRFGALDQPGGTALLERVRELQPEPGDELDRVTAATASPDGRWVGIRSYRSLYLYRTEQLLGTGAVEPGVVDLTRLHQAQGEAVVISADGTMWLTSEAENDESRPGMARLRCDLPTG